MTLKERLTQAEERIATLEAAVAALQQQIPQPVTIQYLPNIAGMATTRTPIWASGSLICPQCGCYYNGVHYCVPTNSGFYKSW